MSKIPEIKPGECTVLPDGRKVKFVRCNIDAMDDPCEGCAFEHEMCTPLHEHIGSCGSGRSDGVFGVFVECK